MDRSSSGGWRKKGRESRRQKPDQPAAKPDQPAAKPEKRAAKPSRRQKPEESSAAWKNRRANRSQAAGASRTVGFFCLALVLMLLIGVFIWYTFRRVKQTPLIMVTVTQYASPIPPNAYAREDANRLSRINDKNLNLQPDGRNGHVDRDSLLEGLRAKLAAEPAGGPGKDVTILYVSAHGVVDEDNQPCLLCSDSNALDSSTWLPVSQVLEVIKQSQVDIEPQQRKVILLLDASRIDADWSLGVLYNGFVQRVEDILPVAEVPGLYLITAASPGQIAWSAPDLEGTAFGFYAAKGLSREASPRDKSITLLEFFRYVEREVSRWALHDRDADQHPRLLPPVPDGADFPIAFAGGETIPPPELDRVKSLRQDVAGMFDQLSPLWEAHDRAIADRHAQQTDPLGLAVVQRKLLRLEQLALAGTDYRSKFTETLGEVSTELPQLGIAPLPTEVNAYSIPLAAQLERLDEAPLRAMIEQWRAAGGRPKPKEGEPAPPVPGYLTAAGVATDWLLQARGADRPLLREMTEFIRSSRPRPGFLLSRMARSQNAAFPNLVEVEFLRLLEQHLDWSGLALNDSQDWRIALANASRARRLSEVAAAPEDERVHYFVQPLVDAVDQRRRGAEDRLFVGSPDALGQAATDYAALVGSDGQSGDLAAAIERGRVVAGYFATRDEVWSQLPYLVDWLVGQLQIGSTDEIGQDLLALVDDALLLIKRNGDLAAELERALNGPLGELPPGLVQAHQDVAELHQKICTAYVKYCNYLDNRAGTDKPALRKLDAALLTPLLAAEQRKVLTSKLVGLIFLRGGLAVDADAGDDSGSETGLTETDLAAAKEYLQRLAGWEVHPALALLDRSKLDLLIAERRPKPITRAAGESDLGWLADQGGRVRELLADLRDSANGLESVTTSRLEQTEETAANVRAGLSQADRLSRAAGPFMTERAWADSGKDPAHRLRLIDRYYQLLWHSQRVLDDFWGLPAGPDGDPYFAVVADQYIQSAQALIGLPRTPRHGGQNLLDLLQRRKVAAQRLDLAPRDILTLRDKPDEFHEIDVQWTADVPEGHGAVYVERPESQADADSLIPVADESRAQRIRRNDLPLFRDMLPGKVKQYLTIEQSERVDAVTTLLANLFYRGHLRSEPFRIKGPTYISHVEVQPTARPDAKVKVEGEAKRRGHIMFIYDCSGTMNEPGGDGARKCDSAETAFRSVLDTLKQEEKYEVGLRVYGSRAGFIKGQPLSQRRYATPEAEKAKIHPDEDVERLIPIGPLDQAAVEEFDQKLRNLRPWGQTPLYYAITECYREHDFLRAKQEDAKHIIVITDGANFQSDKDSKKITSKQDVEKVIEETPRYSDVRIDIVGLDTKDEDQAKLDEFVELSTGTGGRYYEAKDTETLVDALREALQLVGFKVSPFGQTTDQEPIPLGNEWSISDVDPLHPEYVVDIVGVDNPPQKPIKLEGGEASLLAYKESSRQLSFPPYVSLRKRGEAVEALDLKTQRRYTVQAMLAERRVNDVEFQVYIQDTDPGTFTARPKHVWAEITTKGIQPEQTFYFADADFVPNEPVPIFRFVAKDWPKSVQSALIRVWFQFAQTAVDPDQAIKVDRLTPSKLSLPSLPGIEFDVDTEPLAGGGYRVNVAEHHDTNIQPDRVRVRIFPEPYQGIGHRYYAGVEIVQHQFDFPQQTPATIEITGSQRIKAEAVHATLPDIPVE